LSSSERSLPEYFSRSSPVPETRLLSYTDPTPEVSSLQNT